VSQLVVGSAVFNDGRIKCWGQNGNGDLGLGDTNNRGDAPAEMGDALPFVSLGSGQVVRSISNGYAGHCAILGSGALKCWGGNGFGELGLGDAFNRGDQPAQMGDSLLAVDLGPGRTAVSVSGEMGTTCAVLDDASVKCWGYNYDGELGLGDTKNRGDQPGQMGADLPPVEL
jgi:alpha-tubulin suppressor-like RCC1 family protein